MGMGIPTVLHKIGWKIILISKFEVPKTKYLAL
jgi:hypothetical protein